MGPPPAIPSTICRYLHGEGRIPGQWVRCTCFLARLEVSAGLRNNEGALYISAHSHMAGIVHPHYGRKVSVALQVGRKHGKSLLGQCHSLVLGSEPVCNDRMEVVPCDAAVGTGGHIGPDLDVELFVREDAVLDTATTAASEGLDDGGVVCTIAAEAGGGVENRGGGDVGPVKRLVPVGDRAKVEALFAEGTLKFVARGRLRLEKIKMCGYRGAYRKYLCHGRNWAT